MTDDEHRDNVRELAPVDVLVLRGTEQVIFTGRTLAAVFKEAGQWLEERTGDEDRERVVTSAAVYSHDEEPPAKREQLILFTVPPQREGQRPYTPADPE